MVVRNFAIGTLVLAVAAVPAAATEPPLPPGNLDWSWVTAPDDGWRVRLEWEPAASATPIAHYLLYRVEGDLPAEPVYVNADATFLVDETSNRVESYVYFLIAVDEDGLLSPPSDPAVVGNAFQCETFAYSISPPDYTLRTECALP